MTEPCRQHLALAIAAALASPIALAGPHGGQVTSGVAMIAQKGAVTRIEQSTAKATIDWQGFGIAAGETVTFRQPSSTAITLNRVVGNEQSVIAGALTANGRVFLVNSNGVLFAKGSRVDAAGLVASTLDLTDADFRSARYVFRGASTAKVVNDGSLTASEGGYVALLGASVSNRGVIVATRGTVALSGGQAIRLDFGGDALLGVSIEAGALAALVDNQGAVLADGGKVVLTAKAAEALLGSQVNASGTLRARTLGELTGQIIVQADGGSVHVAGALDASAPVAGNGGAIETSGTKVVVDDATLLTTRAAHGKTGTWLVDPDGYTVGAGGDITGAALGTQLDHTNVTLSSTSGSGTGGDLKVTDAVNWSADTLLTLNATGSIVIRAPITATGAAAGLAMNYGGYAATGSATAGSDYRIDNITAGTDGSLTIGPAAVTLSGANATLSINGTPYTLIHSMAQLAAISPPVLDGSGHPALDPDTGFLAFLPATGNYALAQNLDASGTTYGYAVVNTLDGTLAGLGHTISHLRVDTTTANAAGQYENAGLVGTFGADTFNQLRDLGLVDATIAGGAAAAGLAVTNNGAIRNVYVTGSITGVQPVGGVVGFNLGSLDDAHADVTISALAGGTYVGGLAGFNGLDATITNATAKGSIAAGGLTLDDGGLQTSSGIGGLVGLNGGVIDGAHSNVAVTTTNSLIVGGLVGENINIAGDTSHAVITNSTASGKVDVTWTNTQGNGQSYGGLVGDNSGGFISGSSASGNVTARATTVDASGVPWTINGVGGLVGTNLTNSGIGGTVTGSSSSGSVTGIGATYQVGGSVGLNVDGSLSGVRATGNVGIGPSGQDVGGLVGFNSGAVTDSAATGSIAGSPGTGGDPLFGTNNGTVANSTYRDAAADAAALQARAVAAARIGGTAITAVEQTAATNAHVDAVGAAPSGSTAALLDTHIVVKDPRRYSANVRRIEVDGQVYEIDDDAKPAPPRPPASAASH